MVINTFLLHVNNIKLRLIEEMKMHIAIISLSEEHSDLETTEFLKLVGSFVFKIKRELKAPRSNMARVSCTKHILDNMTLTRHRN